MFQISKAELLVKKLIPRLQTIPRPRPIKFIQNDVRVVTLAQNTTTVDQQIFEGDLPRRVIIVQILQEAYNGAYNRNPLDFQHFDVQRISVNMNGRNYPLESNELKMDFDGDKITQSYIMAFIQLYDSEFEDLEGLYLTKDNYVNGYFMYSIALSAGNVPPPHGILRLKIDYAKALPSPVVVLVFAEYERTMDMDSKGLIEIE